jgi:hypothetical protein
MNNWRHDQQHQQLNKKCSVESTVEKANALCKPLPDEPHGELPGIEDGPEAWRNNKRFQRCLETKRDDKNKAIQKYFTVEAVNTAESFTDSGDIFEPYEILKHLKGGKKTKRRRNRKTRGKKQKRSRKHA